MSYDIQLDRSTHEVHIDPSTGDLQLVDGAARVAQQIKVTLLLFLGEWFLDTTFGVPYFEDILVKNPRWGTVNAVLRARIADVPGVGRIRRLTLDFNRPTRSLTVTFEAETAFGLVGPHNVSLTLARRGI
jgi:hypothetical protein